MSKLVGTILESSLSNDFTLDLNERQQIGGVRAWLMSVGDPSGTFTYAIKSGVNTLWSDTFNVAEMKSDLSTSATRLHMMKAKNVDPVINLGPGTYTFELSSSGYTASSSSYLAWLVDWEGQYFDASPSLIDNLLRPFHFEIWTYKRQVYR